MTIETLLKEFKIKKNNKKGYFQKTTNIQFHLSKIASATVLLDKEAMRKNNVVEILYVVLLLLE